MAPKAKAVAALVGLGCFSAADSFGLLPLHKHAFSSPGQVDSTSFCAAQQQVMPGPRGSSHRGLFMGTDGGKDGSKAKREVIR